MLRLADLATLAQARDFAEIAVGKDKGGRDRRKCEADLNMKLTAPVGPSMPAAIFAISRGSSIQGG